MGGVEEGESSEDDSTDAWADSEYDSNDESDDIKEHNAFVRSFGKSLKRGRYAEQTITYLRRVRRQHPEPSKHEEVEVEAPWDPTDLS